MAYRYACLNYSAYNTTYGSLTFSCLQSLVQTDSRHTVKSLGLFPLATLLLAHDQSLRNRYNLFRIFLRKRISLARPFRDLKNFLRSPNPY